MNDEDLSITEEELESLQNAFENIGEVCELVAQIVLDFSKVLIKSSLDCLKTKQGRRCFFLAFHAKKKRKRNKNKKGLQE